MPAAGRSGKNASLEQAPLKQGDRTDPLLSEDFAKHSSQERPPRKEVWGAHSGPFQTEDT